MRSATKAYRWRDASEHGLEHLFISTLGQRISARAVVIHGEQRLACSYAIECDRDWRFRHGVFDVLGGKRIEIAFQPPGGWTLDGDTLEGFEDAYEVDFVATCFTNTLPIRRLKLAIGQSASIVTAWIDFPSLEVFPDTQRYTRLDAETYRFESDDFKRDIRVDADGFVVSYPGLFEKV